MHLRTVPSAEQQTNYNFRTFFFRHPATQIQNKEHTFTRIQHNPPVQHTTHHKKKTPHIFKHWNTNFHTVSLLTSK